MKTAALSPYAMNLPSERSTAVVEIGGRQKVVRLGIFFAQMGKHRRAVYENLDGEIILADACTCLVNWTPFLDDYPTLEVRRSLNCPINRHSIAARSREAE